MEPDGVGWSGGLWNPSPHVPARLVQHRLHVLEGLRELDRGIRVELAVWSVAELPRIREPPVRVAVEEARDDRSTAAARG